MSRKKASSIYPNHRSRPILGTIFYRWVLWIDGDDKIRRTIVRVVYILHPTFEKGVVESRDVRGNFRVDATGWGSFYVRVIIYYEGGFSEEIPYYLDVKQFFEREGPPNIKKCPQVEIDEKKLVSLYENGYRDFSKVSIIPSNNQFLIGKVLIGTNFMNASLTGIEMQGANLAMCNFHGANLTNTNLSGVNFTNSRLSSADISGSVIYGINNTDWIIDDIKATHIFVDARANRRIPYNRDFGPQELSSWLGTMKNLEEIVPPNAPKVFISYSWKDENAVLAVDQWLRDHGIEVVIDRRDFIVGGDLYDEIVEKITYSDKVIIFYSMNSKDRHYTTLEGRIVQELEAKYQAKGERKILLIYLQLDDEELPIEVSHRLSIRAKGRSFIEVCEKLLDGIMEKKSSTPRIDLKQYKHKPPW